MSHSTNFGVRSKRAIIAATLIQTECECVDAIRLRPAVAGKRLEPMERHYSESRFARSTANSAQKLVPVANLSAANDFRANNIANNKCLGRPDNSRLTLNHTCGNLYGKRTSSAGAIERTSSGSGLAAVRLRASPTMTSTKIKALEQMLPPIVGMGQLFDEVQYTGIDPELSQYLCQCNFDAYHDYHKMQLPIGFLDWDKERLTQFLEWRTTEDAAHEFESDATQCRWLARYFSRVLHVKNLMPVRQTGIQGKDLEYLLMGWLLHAQRLTMSAIEQTLDKGQGPSIEERLRWELDLELIVRKIYGERYFMNFMKTVSIAKQRDFFIQLQKSYDESRKEHEKDATEKKKLLEALDRYRGSVGDEKVPVSGSIELLEDMWRLKFDVDLVDKMIAELQLADNQKVKLYASKRRESIMSQLDSLNKRSGKKLLSYYTNALKDAINLERRSILYREAHPNKRAGEKTPDVLNRWIKLLEFMPECKGSQSGTNSTCSGSSTPTAFSRSVSGCSTP